MTETSDPALVKSFMQWKLEMVEMPEHCQIVAVEMWHGHRLLQEWDSPLLYASREILILSTVTGWNFQKRYFLRFHSIYFVTLLFLCVYRCPEDLKYGNITWIVKFNEEACRMIVDYIPEISLETSFIY